MLVPDDREELLICRTNGALERFNRELNHAFPNACPSLSVLFAVQTSIHSTIEWLRERIKHRCISQLIFSQFQLLTIPLLMLLQLFEQYNICNNLTIAATFKLYVYTLSSVLTIDIILPTPFLNYTTALVK